MAEQTNRRHGRPPGARNKDRGDPVARRLAQHCEQHIEQQVEAIGKLIVPKLAAQFAMILAAFGVEPSRQNVTQLAKVVAQVYSQATPNDQIPHVIAQRLAHAWHTQLALNYIDKALAELGGAKEERHEHDDHDVG